MIASRGRLHILDVVEGLSCYMCRQWHLDHVEKTVLLHAQTVEPRTHREDRYATRANGSVSWPSTHSRRCRRTVVLHVQTAAPRPHREDRYATCVDGSASWSLQILPTLSSNRLATCADGGASTTTLRYMCGLRYRVWLYRTRRSYDS